MTRDLKLIFDRVAQLPESRQDEVAAWLADELEDENAGMSFSVKVRVFWRNSLGKPWANYNAVKRSHWIPTTSEKQDHYCLSGRTCCFTSRC